MVLKNVARDVICQEVQTVSLIEQPNSQGKIALLQLVAASGL